MNRLTLMQTQVSSPSRHSTSRTHLATVDVEHPPSTVLPDTSHETLYILPPSGIDRVVLKTVDIRPNQTVAIDTDSPIAASPSAPHLVPQADTHVRECTMLVTINADCVNELRHLMVRTCGRLLVFIRTQPVAHAKKMQVWLCLNAPAADLVMDAVMRALPSAEFGPVTYA